MRTLLVALTMALISSTAPASELKVMAAGSLKDAFTAIFADFNRQYGASFAPVYGPSGGLRERLQKGEAFDVFASAALPHAQALTDAGIAGPSMLFTRNAMCVVTAADSKLETGNLIDTLLEPDTRFGTSTPVSSPSDCAGAFPAESPMAAISIRSLTARTLPHDAAAHLRQ